MVKIVPQADAKSASMGWFFDPGFIQKVQRMRRFSWAMPVADNDKGNRAPGSFGGPR